MSPHHQVSELHYLVINLIELMVCECRDRIGFVLHKKLDRYPNGPIIRRQVGRVRFCSQIDRLDRLPYLIAIETETPKIDID